MHNTVGAPTVNLNGTSVGMSGSIALYQHHTGVNAHAHCPAESHTESGCGPTAIGVVTDLGICFIPQARVVGSSERDVKTAARQAENRGGELKIATAGAAVHWCARRVAN